MLLTNKQTNQFTLFYLLCFLINGSWFWYNNLLLSSIEPIYFINKLDFTRNILMLSNVQHYLINGRWLRITFDLLYYLLPILLTIVFIKKIRGRSIVAYITCTFTIIYSLFFSSFTYISMEGYLGWILFPLIFSALTVISFYYYMHAIRIIFILIFVSAAILKIKSGAVFNIEQMSGILLMQHNNYLVSNPNNWFSKFVYFLVQHKAIAQSLFLLGTIAEMSFILGLFTFKFDRLLIIIFCLFLVFDYFLMQINYFTWMVFMSCFYFSTYKIEVESSFK